MVQLPTQSVVSAQPKRYPMVQLPTQSVESGRSGFSILFFERMRDWKRVDRSWADRLSTLRSVPALVGLLENVELSARVLGSHSTR